MRVSTKRLIRVGSAILLTTCLAGTARASLISFESVHGSGSPADGMSIGTQYASSTGMSFSLQGGGSPVLANAGGSRTAFQGYGGQPDLPAPGEAVGSWFLTDDGVVGPPPLPLIVSFASPVGMAGGQILDIDGTESWRIEAYDGADTLLDSVTLSSSTAHAGDGLATDWAFLRVTADIARIELIFTGAYDHDIGEAFDNFWTDTVTPHVTNTPEPSTIVLLLTGVVAGGIPLWRRRRPHHDRGPGPAGG